MWQPMKNQFEWEEPPGGGRINFLDSMGGPFGEELIVSKKRMVGSASGGRCNCWLFLWYGTKF